MLTVLGAIVVFDSAATAGSIGALFGCILGGTLYRQAPPRALLPQPATTPR